MVLESTRGEVLPKMVVTRLHGKEVSRTSRHPTHNKQDEHPDGPQTCWLGLRKFFKKKQHKCALSFQKHMPTTHLFSTIFSHVIPVGKFLITTAVQAQRKPTNHFFTFHAALIVNGYHQSDIRQLEQCNLYTSE